MLCCKIEYIFFFRRLIQIITPRCKPEIFTFFKKSSRKAKNEISHFFEKDRACVSIYRQFPPIYIIWNIAIRESFFALNMDFVENFPKNYFF